ncbi:MAG: XrtA system polysaccharide chain length determinant [Burkholderiaceae bacterium]
MNEIVEQLRRALRDIWLHRWIGLIAAWLIVIVGAVSVYLMPDQYEASARVYVDTQSVLKPLMSGLTVEPNLDQQIAMMSRTLISRPNIEKVVGMSDLNLVSKTSEQTESQIDYLTRAIDLRSSGGINLYTIAFRNSNPDTARKVVQSLLTIFVESNLGNKRKDSDTARRFIDDQIKSYEQKLTQAENALKEFKINNMATMSGNGKDYFTQMSEAGNELATARLSLEEAENGRTALRRQMSGDDTVLLGGGTDTQGVAVPEIDTRIAALRHNLDEMRLRFTDAYPDIISTKRIIAELEDQKKAEVAAMVKASPTRSPLSTNPVYQQLQVQLAQAESDVASLQTRVASYEGRYNKLKAAANNVPKIEADLQQLNRDYEVNKANYEKLIGRRESAQMSSDMDASAGLVEFRVIDPPRVSPRPVAPNRVLLVSMVFLGALAGGVGVAFLMGQIRPTFSDRKALREISGLPILGTVTMIWTDGQVRARRRKLTWFVAGAAGLVCLYGAGLAFFLARSYAA